MKLSCLIVDDEPLSIRIIEKYIADLPSLEITGKCTNAFQAMECLKKEAIDLLFLDINMPKLSGLGLLKTLSNPPMVILTTAYPEFAVEGFELNVLDYLVKPFGFERFLKAINKAMTSKEIEQKLQNNPPGESGALLVKADRKLYKVKHSEILYLQAYGDYVKIFTAQGMLMPKEKLQELIHKLPESDFMQVHRSYVVALNRIEFIEGNLLRLGEENIPISNKYRQLVMDYFNQG